MAALSFPLKPIDQMGAKLFFFFLNEILFQAGFWLLVSHSFGFQKLNVLFMENGRK